MTRKSIAKQVDALIEQTAAAHGVTNFADRKGIDPLVHMINGKVFEALMRFTPALVAATNPPAPATPAEIAAELADGLGEITDAITVEETDPAIAA